MGVSNHLTLALAAVSALGVEASLPLAQGHLPRNVNLPGRRAVSNAPNGYVPTNVSCPEDRPTIRNGSSLSSTERDWTEMRRNETIQPIRELLQRLAIPDFNSEQYLRNVETNSRALPNIGLAVSGGGYRAMLNGAGAIAAWDSRSQGSTSEGNLGGLLQSATYLSGLSGGAWLVGSLYVNNWTSVQDHMRSGNLWQTQDSILEGPESIALLSYYDDIFSSVGDKDDAHYERSITDYWGRMLSYQLINDTEGEGGPGMTFSSIADDEEFRNGRTPLPFIVANGRDPGEEILSINSTVFEFDPWELGSSDPTLHAYVPLRYVGTAFDGGDVPDDTSCVRGFDNAGFVMGTSSSLFNAIVLYLEDPENEYVPDGVPPWAVEALVSVLSAWGDTNNDIADWTPNPFRNYNDEHTISGDHERLTLVDGGEDLQNVPYHPHLHIEREVDVVFSIDSSADTEYAWPNGASPIATYQRSLEDISEGTGFPAVPGQDSFINLGLNSRPTFFGCNTTNITDPAPLIVYIPNYPYVYNSNISTFTVAIPEDERDAIVENGWAVATMQNATRDANWPVCVGCAILHHSFERTNTSVPQACRDCFNEYCWDGTIDESDPGAYDPEPFGTLIEIESAAPAFVGSTAVAMAISAAVGMALML